MKKIRIFMLFSWYGLLLLSCEKEHSREDFRSFLLSNAQETYSYQWNFSSLDTVYGIDISNNLYALVSVKVINSREELFGMLSADTAELSEKEQERLKKLPQHIDVDFTKQSVVYFGLYGQVCNRVVANVHQEKNSYIIRVLSYLPDDWGTNWFVDTMACSAVFPKIPAGATFSIETVEIEGGTQEAKKIMSNENWFDIRN